MIGETVRLSRFNPDVTYSATTTWTSISDIGVSFEDGKFTAAEYERTEAAYLEAIEALYEDANSPQLTVGDVEFTPLSTRKSSDLTDGSLVAGSRVLEICRWALREELSCRLDAGEFYVHFGFDYYVYLGLEALFPQTIAKIRQLGLFLERDVPSPYVEVDGGGDRR